MMSDKKRARGVLRFPEAGISQDDADTP
jgi:hypothetical protein